MHGIEYLLTWNTDQPNPTYTPPNDSNADEYNAVLDAWRQEVREALPSGEIHLTVGDGFGEKAFDLLDVLRYLVGWEKGGPVAR